MKKTKLSRKGTAALEAAKKRKKQRKNAPPSVKDAYSKVKV